MHCVIKLRLVELVDAQGVTSELLEYTMSNVSLGSNMLAIFIRGTLYYTLKSPKSCQK